MCQLTEGDFNTSINISEMKNIIKYEFQIKIKSKKEFKGFHKIGAPKL
jgi:hypothetical protein